MRIDRRLLNWGVFFVLLGGIPLAVQQGWIPDDVRWWQLWPLILIGIGVGVILRRTTFDALGGLIVAATFGLMLGGALATGMSGFGSIGIGCAGGSSAGTPFTTQDGTFTGDRATIRLEMGCGDLAVDTSSGTAWSLSGNAPDGQLPEIDRTDTSLTVRDPDANVSDFFRERSSWSVTLPTDSTLDLSATVNAGEGELRLAGSKLDDISLKVNAGSGRVELADATASRLSVDVNAGSAVITLPDGSMTGTLTVNAGSMKFCAPPGVALRLHTNDNITAGDNYQEAGLQSAGENTWQSSDWATATKRIELTTTANAGSFTLNPEDGCQ